MEKLYEILELLRKAMPLLQQFADWKNQEAERERQMQEQESESEQEFKRWLAQREKEQAQQEADAAELKKDFFGGENWEKNHLFPKPY